MPLIRDCLKSYPTGVKKLDQLQKKMAGLEGYVVVDNVMKEFVLMHDQHSTDTLLMEWRGLHQMDRESINEFHV